MILKPFMLRRCKKDVENELSDKIEVIVYCPLTKRQRYLYQAVKNKIRIEDLLSSTSAGHSSSSSLMNLVMQFRKVSERGEGTAVIWGIIIIIKNSICNTVSTFVKNCNMGI